MSRLPIICNSNRAGTDMGSHHRADDRAVQYNWPKPFLNHASNRVAFFWRVDIHHSRFDHFLFSKPFLDDLQ